MDRQSKVLSLPPTIKAYESTGLFRPGLHFSHKVMSVQRTHQNVLLAICLAAVAIMPACAQATLQRQSLAPPMGWNPWNAFRTEVTKAKIVAVAQAMRHNGLAEAGYRYINVDDGWWLKRNAQQEIVVRTSMFPSAALPGGKTSLRPFVNDLHAMGFLAGLYTDVGRNACS